MAFVPDHQDLTRARGQSEEPDQAPWIALARCRDLAPKIFFPSDGPGVEVAKRYCAECLVKRACLEFALENQIHHGVWGGTSERERRRIAKRRREKRLAEPPGRPR
jgi:WhiB family transcriptional regulator, redox-sensing transcriptional regulator